MILAALDRWRAGTPTLDKVGWLGRVSYAHRGLHGGAEAENSPSAFAGAIAQGMGIECDVQRSSDGLAIVFHDYELDRMTAESGPVSARTAADLHKLTLGSSSDPIPTLRDLLDLVGGKVPLLIEIKSRRESRYSALCLAVRRVLEGYRGEHAIMSFDPRVVRWFADHSPLTVRGLVVTEEDAKALPGRIKRRLALWHARPDFLAYDIRDLPSAFAASQRRRGLPVLTWTVRSTEHRERAAQYADAPIAEGAGVA